MKIFPPELIRQLDAHTIQHEPIAPIDLMERAAKAFTGWFRGKFPPERCGPVFTLSGPGNNGGDGLAIARLLADSGYQVAPMLLEIGTLSQDCRSNLERLEAQMPVQRLTEADDFPDLPAEAVVVDALFGSGLSRPLEGLPAELVTHLNGAGPFGVTLVSVDIASGLFAHQHTPSKYIVRPRYTVSFQLPKLAFFMPDNAFHVGEWKVLDIGLSAEFITQQATEFCFLSRKLVRPLLQPRDKFSHKGTYGHALLMGGSAGKIGAMILATQAALRSGAGLATAYVPKIGYVPLQTAIPEAMCVTDNIGPQECLSTLPQSGAFDAVAVGPGLGKRIETLRGLEKYLHDSNQPLVIDADAINLIAQHRRILKDVPAGSVFTPHPKEFARLVGNTSDSFERLEAQRAFCAEHKVYIALKGAHTAIATPDGRVFFNATGNPGMATGGTGDALTGIIVGLQAQGYTAEQATLLGVYLHGQAGDLAAQQHGQASMLASDLIAHIGAAYEKLWQTTV